MPRISVVLPVYNSAKYLRQAVDSLLAQTYTDFEIIAIDDGSTDDSFDILTRYAGSKVRVLRNASNSGLIYTLNRGLEESTGELVARMDADDISFPYRFERQVSFLDSNPGIALVGAFAEEMDARGEPLSLMQYPTDPDEIHAGLLIRSCFCHPTVMFRKDAVIAVGGYRQEFRHAEDYDLWLRLSDRYRLANIGEPLLRYRIHANQICFRNQTTQFKAAQSCVAEALKRRGITGREAGIILLSPLDRLLAAPGTIGRNYISYAWDFAMMQEPGMAWKASALSVLHSPLSLDAWRSVFFHTMVNVLGRKFMKHANWYSAKIKRLIGRG